MMSTMQDKIYSSTLFRSLIMFTLGVSVVSMRTSPALAETLPDRTKDYLKCSEIVDLSPRLACYDAVSAALQQGPQDQVETAPAAEAPAATSPVASADTAESNAEFRANFGAQHIAREPEQEEPDEIRVLVTSWSTSPLGKMIFTTEDGQIWRQSDSNRVFPRSEQFSATIKKGMMGSFFLKIDGIRRAIRVKRVR